MEMASERKREVLDLTHKQLLMLSDLIHLQEVEKLKELELDHVQTLQYLNSCREAWETTNNILNDIQTTKDKVEAEKDAAKIPIAHDIFTYSTWCVNISLQFIRSYDTRLVFMKKLSDHTTDLIQLLNTLDPAIHVEEILNLAKMAAEYKKYIIDYQIKLNSFGPNMIYRWIKEKSFTVDVLVIKAMKELGFQGAFEALEDIQKLQVYEKVIEEAGRGKSVVTHTYEAMGKLGVSVLIFTAATMVWDIATAENKFEAATRDSVSLLVGQIPVGDFATAVISVGLEALEIEVATAVVTFVGSVVGIGVGILIGAAAGELLDVIFNKGGKVRPSDGLTVCLVAPMPHGLELARNIKRNYPEL